nr:molecular chaperone [Pseudomonas cavernicola]
MRSMFKSVISKTFVAGLGLSALVLASSASASVVVTGTRVIYPGDVREKTVQLSNEDDHPNVVQAWVDTNNPNSTPNDADAPFVVTPPMFRMEPKAGQSLRIVFTGQGLPQDRESVYYLNVLQIPPRNEAYKEQNQMLVLLRNRMKLFYRPSGIVGKPADVADQLRFSLAQGANGWHVNVDNPTGYYASFNGASVSVGGRELSLKADMVAPKSQGSWQLDKAGSLPAGAASVRAVLVNDYGAQIEIKQELKR